MKAILLIAVLLLVFLAAITAMSPTPCQACVVDWCAWYRTATVPYALDVTRRYYVPRRPPCCACSLYQMGQGAPCPAPGDAACSPYAPETSDGLEPPGLEPLGQIPNDMLLEALRASR